MKSSEIIVLTLLLNFIFLNVSQAALVTCGTVKNPCTFCHLGDLLKNIVNWLLTIYFPLAAAVVAYGGALYVFSFGSPQRAAQGQAAIKAAVIGMVIVLGAWMIVGGFLYLVTGNSVWLTKWNAPILC